MAKPTTGCSKRVYAGTFKGHPCTKPATVEREGKAYCTVHDPERKAKLRREREDAAERDRRARIAGAEDQIVGARIRRTNPKLYESLLNNIEAIEL